MAHLSPEETEKATQSASRSAPIAATFVVDPKVELGPKLEQKPANALEKAWRSVGKLEASSPQPPEGVVRVFSRCNLLAEAVHQAFYNHYPLKLSPDVIWLTIAQGFANHVDQNAERLRSKFVDFQGKKTLELRCVDFVKGSPDNDWASVFPAFSRMIASSIGQNTVDLIECNFSTTGPVERIVSHITLMYVFRGASGREARGRWKRGGQRERERERERREKRQTHRGR